MVVVFGGSSSSVHWPNNKLLAYRRGVMNKKAEDRKLDRDSNPYRCERCHAGCKTLWGLMTRHAGSQKCAKKIGKMSAYSTPCKTEMGEEEREDEFE